MSWNSSVAAPFLLTFLFLTSCVIPIPVPASRARAAAKLEPPAQYNHAYDGQVVERVMHAFSPQLVSMKRTCQIPIGGIGPLGGNT